jgi:hypothetical protein
MAMSDDTTGAVDHDYDDAARDYSDRLADALADVPTDPEPGCLVIDLVTRQLLYVTERVADSCQAYEQAEGFDLVTYKMHPWLPGIGADNAVYECVYLDANPQNAHKPGKTYDFPEARLMRVPHELAHTDMEVGSL